MVDVLLVSPTAAPGGSERALVGLATRLPDYRLTCRVLLLEHGPFEEWLGKANLAVDVIPMGRTRHLWRTAAVVTELRRRCQDVSVVVANQSKAQAIAGLAAVTTRTPCVWWQHGIPTRSPIELSAALLPSAAVVCGSTVAARAQKRLTPRRRVEQIAPGVDLTSIRRWSGTGATIREHYGLFGRPLVGIVARLQPGKGQELFLRAAALLATSIPRVRFLVIGGAVLGWEGDYPESLRRLAESLGIADRVTFTGHQDNVYPWFDALDVAVTASEGDAFGLVTVEALALGRPVVGVRSAGTAEILEDGYSGILVPPDEPDAMAQAIASILIDDALSSRLRSGAAERALWYSDATMAKQFADLIHDVAKLSPQPPSAKPSSR